MELHIIPVIDHLSSYLGHPSRIPPKGRRAAFLNCIGFGTLKSPKRMLLQFEGQNFENWGKGCKVITHRIYRIGILTYIYHKKSTIHVGKYASSMDGRGNKASVVSPKEKNPRSSYKPRQCLVGFVWFKDYALPRVQKNLLLCMKHAQHGSTCFIFQNAVNQLARFQVMILQYAWKQFYHIWTKQHL